MKYASSILNDNHANSSKSNLKKYLNYGHMNFLIKIENRTKILSNESVDINIYTYFIVK